MLDIGAGASGFDGGGEVVVAAFVFEHGDPGVSDAAQLAEGTLDFGGGDFFTADIGDFADATKQAQFAMAIPLAEIGERGVARRAARRRRGHRDECGPSRRASGLPTLRPLSVALPVWS